MRTLALSLLLAAVSAGCAQEQDTSAEQRRDHVWQGQVQALEKAKTAEGTVLDAAARQREQIDRQ